MGKSTFYLDQEINRYISAIARNGATSTSDVAELRDHLFDATDSLMRTGLSREEAFLIATRRLGTVQTLSDEYEKANPANGKAIWVFAILGFNIIYSFPSMLLLLMQILYQGVYDSFNSSIVSALILLPINMAVVFLIIFYIGRRDNIARFLQDQVSINPVRIVSISFVPFVVFYSGRFIIPHMLQKHFFYFNQYHLFNNVFIEYGAYLMMIAFVASLVFLIFSVSRKGYSTVRALFENPSIPLLIYLGATTETIAAMTRIFHAPVVVNAVIFGGVFLIACLMMIAHNRSGLVIRDILIFYLFGLVTEITVGIQADMSRGNTVFTVYFVTALIIGMAISIGFRKLNRLDPQTSAS